MGEASDQHKRDQARRKLLDAFEEKKAQIAKENELVSGKEKFISQHDDVEAQLKSDTIGLVHLDDFKKRREELESKKQDAKAAAEARQKESAQRAESTARAEAKQKRKRKSIATAGPKVNLSFDYDGEEDLEATQPSLKRQHGPGVEKRQRVPSQMQKQSPPVADVRVHTLVVSNKKNPGVDTSFLPDREREECERLERERLKAQWIAEQEIIKAQKIPIAFSFYDGRSHRGSCEVKKGDSIYNFLDKAKASFPSLRGVPADNLIYVKEDLIIPHHYTFYEFIINKARGKSGPLFSFGVHDDIRLVNDASLEKADSHAGKICERSWYERHKHIFPASRWEMYDPSKIYDKYTIKDRAKFGAQNEGKKVQLAFH